MIKKFSTLSIPVYFIGTIMLAFSIVEDKTSFIVNEKTNTVYNSAYVNHNFFIIGIILITLAFILQSIDTLKHLKIIDRIATTLSVVFFCSLFTGSFLLEALSGSVAIISLLVIITIKIFK